ncbi:MAG: hypothetical protein IPJ01_07470 [Micavibrio sp.]|nr:hypothetical protein [Micavibrio sp.]
MKKLTIIAVLFTLTSCAGGASQYQLNSAMQKANEAAANCGPQAMPSDLSLAWEKVRKLDEEQCPHGTNNTPLPSSQAVERNDCMAKLVRQYVQPVTTKSKSLERFISQNKALSKSYQKGEIDRDTVNNRINQNWQEYAVSEISYYKLAQCQNSSFQQYVMPVYHNKGVLADFMAKKLEIALKVDQGKLTTQQGDLEMQKAFAEFAASEQNANAAIQAQNAQAWREYAAGMRQVSQQLNQQQAIKAQQCGSIDIPPMASIGCKNICINGSWAEVC